MESLATESGATAPSPSAGTNDTHASATAAPPASVTRTTMESPSMRPCLALWSPPATTSTDAASCATSTDAVALSSWNDAVTTPEPFPTAVAIPADPTVNTVVSLLVQVGEAPNSAPYWSLTTAAKSAVSPRNESVADAGDTVIDTARGGSGGGGGSGTTGVPPSDPPQALATTTSAVPAMAQPVARVLGYRFVSCIVSRQ